MLNSGDKVFCPVIERFLFFPHRVKNCKGKRKIKDHLTTSGLSDVASSLGGSLAFVVTGANMTDEAAAC